MSPKITTINALPTHDQQSSTQISAEPSPLYGKVKLEPAQQGIAQFEPVQDKTEKPWKLCSSYRSSTQDIDLKKFEEFDAKQIDELWKEVKAYLPDGAKKIRVDLGSLTIRYTNAADKICYLDVSKTGEKSTEKMINLIHKVRNAAQKVWVDLRLGHKFNDEANRAAGALKPLQIPSDDWKGKMPKSIEQFVKDGHFEQLAKVSGNDESRVLKSIMAAEAYIQRLKQAAEDKKRELEEARGEQNFHNRPAAEQKEIKSSIDQLGQFISELDKLDRLPLYFAVGIWGDADSKKVTKEKRFELAGLIAEGVESTLMRSLKPGVDERWWITQKLGLKDKEANAILGAGPFIKTYAGDAGDLIIPEKLDYIERISEGKREARAPSLIEFVTQAVIQGDPSKTEEAYDRMKLAYTSGVKEALVEGANKALSEARATDITGYKLTDKKLKFETKHLQKLAAGAA